VLLPLFHFLRVLFVLLLRYALCPLAAIDGQRTRTDRVSICRFYDDNWMRRQRVLLTQYIFFSLSSFPDWPTNGRMGLLLLAI
jgi:hypothetical protein